MYCMKRKGKKKTPMLSNSNRWKYTNFTLTLKCLDNNNKNEFPIERENLLSHCTNLHVPCKH